MRNLRLALGCLVLIPIATAAGAADWPHLRGPAYDGTADTAERAAALELAWRIDLGSGYSGIAIAGDRAVTMFADGESDVIAAFDAADGRELWRHRLGEINRGRDGSADGPLSSPAIHDGRVFALAPRGQLLALALEDGELLWSLGLTEQFGAPEPQFGFGSSPVVADGVLVVLAGGGEGNAIVGLDPATGETRWQLGDGTIEYQTPIAMTLGSRRQVVAVAGKKILGLLPASGEILWTHAFADDESVASSTPTAVGRDRFLVFVHGQAVVLRATADADGRLSVDEVYRNKNLGQTYGLPIYHEGHIYGFRGQILTCINAETGERVWRSRPPGGRGLILVGDQLVIFGAGGHLVLADATPEGYRERARLAAMELGSGYTWPSYAGGRVLVRNLSELAAVDLVAERESGSAVAAAGGDDPAHAFGRFIAELGGAADKNAAIDAFLERQESFPIREGDLLHFVYRGEADDVAVAGNLIASGSPQQLARVPGTDFFHATLEAAPGVAWEYHFIKDFGEQLPDPLNPHRVPGRGRQELSVARPPGYTQPAFVTPGEGTPRGRLEKVTFASELLGSERELEVYLPPGYDDSGADYPLLLVQEGPEWLHKGRLAAALDHLIGREIEPLVAVFFAPRGAWWEEAGGTDTGRYVRMLAEEMVPYLDRHYRLRDAPRERAILGGQGFGLAAAYAALTHPETIGQAAVQSVYLGMGYGAQLMEAIAGTPRPEVAFYVGWERYGSVDLDSGSNLREDSRRLAEALAAGGYEVAGGEVDASWGWGDRRKQIQGILKALFPLG